MSPARHLIVSRGFAYIAYAFIFPLVIAGVAWTWMDTPLMGRVAQACYGMFLVAGVMSIVFSRLADSEHLAELHDRDDL